MLFSSRRTFVKRVSVNLPYKSAQRCFSLDFEPIEDMVDPLDETARSALAKSCYLKIDWKINQNATVYEAINRMAANNIGALAVTGNSDDVIGIISERDYLKKGELLGRSAKELKVSEVATTGVANLVSVTLDNPIDACMKKMIDRNVRHLLIRRKDTGKMVGMISVKDIVKCSIYKYEAMVNKLVANVVESEAMRKDF